MEIHYDVEPFQRQARQQGQSTPGISPEDEDAVIGESQTREIGVAWTRHDGQSSARRHPAFEGPQGGDGQDEIAQVVLPEREDGVERGLRVLRRLPG